MSGGSSLWYIQKAVWKILTSDAMLMSQIVGVFDFVPDNTNFPYVQIGEFTTGPFETFDEYGQEVTMTIHVWSQRLGPKAYQGMMQAENIMDSVQRLLCRTTFPLNLWSNVGCWGDFSQTYMEADGITRHGVLRYRIKVLQNIDSVKSEGYR
jgi:hypothetical protein